MSRAVILMYHIIDDPRSSEEAKYCCPSRVFEDHMRHLAEAGCAIGLPDLIAGLQGDRALPDGAVAVTFDDGFAATYEHGMPILKRYDIPATMFLVSGRLGRDNDWMTPRGFPRRELVTREQARAMRQAGMTIGSHTRSHPRLTEVRPEVLDAEIAGSKVDLEDSLGEEVAYFAYPFGLHNDASREAVARAGYRGACSVRSGFNSTQVDRYELRRIEVYGSDSPWRFRQKLKFGRNDSGLTYPLSYYASRFLARFSSL